MATIALENVSRRFPGGTVAVRDFTLAAEDGEFMVIVGPSGSGKSTVLRMVAGLEATTSGVIRIGDRVVNDLPPRDRDVAMVFQNYALYPHMSVFENMAFGLRVRKTSPGEVGRRVKAAATLLGLESLLERKPRQLSGGQRQRVAMGRAIVREPVAFLMDEPLSNLDARLRIQMRTEVAQLQQRLRTTTLYVTHDQTEAMTMGDRVAVMRRGALQQVDRPQALYDRPCNLFVAEFMGSPAMNVVLARLESAGERRIVAVFGKHRLAVSPRTFERCPHLGSFIGREVVLGIRPEDMQDATMVPGADPGRQLSVTISVVEPVGAELIVHFPVDGMGQLSFVARLTPRIPARENETRTLVVDVERIYLFNPTTHEAIGGPGF